MTSFAVLGPGGVGGFIAAALARAGEAVTVVAREGTAELIERDGLSVESVILGNFHARPAAVASLSAPVDVMFIATKATGLEAALERIETVPDLIVPLLNGLDHLPRLRQRFSAERVAAGTIRIEADRPEPGRIVHTSRFLRVDLAADDPAVGRRGSAGDGDRRPARPALECVAEVLSRAEVPARIGASEAEILWSKLVRLNALACTTSASGQRLGFIRSDPTWRAALKGAVAEGAAVARAEGADVDPAGSMAELEQAHAELGSSMQRDIAAGREPELDAIAGSVLRAGRRHGIDCPTITRLAAEVARRAGIDPPQV